MEIINTESNYKKAIQQTMQIFHVEEGTTEEDELALILVLVKDYEDNIRLPKLDLIEAVKLRKWEKEEQSKRL